MTSKSILVSLIFQCSRISFFWENPHLSTFGFKASVIRTQALPTQIYPKSWPHLATHHPKSRCRLEALSHKPQSNPKSTETYCPNLQTLSFSLNLLKLVEVSLHRPSHKNKPNPGQTLPPTLSNQAFSLQSDNQNLTQI